MVRFKVSLFFTPPFASYLKTDALPLLGGSLQNRWFLVEFLFPSSQPVPSRSSTSTSSTVPLSTAPGSSYLPPPPSKKKKRKPNENPSAGPSTSTSSSSKPPPPSSSDSDDDEGSSEDSDEDPNDTEPHWPLLGPLPLLLPPPPNPISGKQKKLDERSIYHALKSSVIQAFGDDGWGRVGGNTSGESVSHSLP